MDCTTSLVGTTETGETITKRQRKRDKAKGLVAIFANGNTFLGEVAATLSDCVILSWAERSLIGKRAKRDRMDQVRAAAGVASRPKPKTVRGVAID
ncbi:MAG: hypothetical protein ACRC62_15800 [Microcoleus sp.]